MTTFPTLYIPHGGGPCFFMDWDPPDTWTRMAAWLRYLGGSIGARPEAILVISAHWEEDEFTVTTHPTPPLLFDYSGFPSHTYALTYPAPGSRDLAGRVYRLLQDAGIPLLQDEVRGFDHGVFIPFKLIYPDADIPIVQLSLKVGLDPSAHLALGEALAPLRDQGILIVGSGMSYHNLRAFFGQAPNAAADLLSFDRWLGDSVAAPAAARNEALRQWRQAPAARAAHPREEHLLPLMVVAGAANGDLGRIVYHDIVLDLTLSAVQFG